MIGQPKEAILIPEIGIVSSSLKREIGETFLVLLDIGA